MRTAFTVQLDRPRSLRALNFSATVEAIKRRGPRHYTALGDLAANMGLAYRSAFVRRNADPSEAIELLSQSDMFAAETSGRRIRLDSFQNPGDHLVRRGQLLVAGVGTLGETELFGRSILADERLVGKYISEDVFAITFKKTDDVASLFASAFFATRTGIWAVRSASYGTKTLKLQRELMAELPIPRPSPSEERKVAELMRAAIEQRERYSFELRAARGLLEGMQEMRDAHAMCAERRARCVTWTGALPTLSAWTYASTGDALQYLRRRWAPRVRDYIEPGGLFTGLRFARVPCEAPAGINLLSQRDVFMIRRVPRRVVHPNIDPRRLIADESQLLIACDGQFTEGSLFGKIEDARAGLVGQAVTQHMLRLVPSANYKSCLYAFFSTDVGHRLLKSTAVGTSVPMMRHDLVADLPVPPINHVSAQIIESHVERALTARREADTAETEAIRIIEEEVLPAWLA